MDSESEDLLAPALVVNDDRCLDFDLNVPPTSGNEYLRRVRQEAQDCPKIVVASIDSLPFKSQQTANMHHVSGCLPAPKGYAYGITWQKAQVDNFADLRQEMARQIALRKKLRIKSKVKLPAISDVSGWCRLCFGHLNPPGTKTYQVAPQEEGMEEIQLENCGSPPYTDLVLAMDQNTVIRVLEYHINWFEATGFTQQQGCWFYALLCCLQKPLSPETCDLLRCLARNCANLRATLESTEDERLGPLNLFICLVSRYFDQMDLADNIT